jgi:DNA-binding response OmpR family regulator
MPEQTQPAQIPKKILLVEDTVQLREALERYLKQEGLQVISAVDGEEGLAKAREFTPDFILTDIFMPRLGGIDMIKQIRITEWGRDIPVILLSNFSLDRDSLESVKQIGKLKYLTKSDFSLKEVVQSTMEMLYRYSQPNIITPDFTSNPTVTPDPIPQIATAA